MHVSRRPTLIVQRFSPDEITIRFWNIGNRTQFLTLLSRFRSEFFLARATQIEGMAWLILSAGQFPELRDFCRRYGITIVREEE